MSRTCKRSSDIILTGLLTALFLFLIPLHSAHANCTGPDGSSGTIFMNIDHSLLQYCDGTKWLGLGDTGTGGGGDLLYFQSTGGIFTSTDKGVNWSQISNTGAQLAWIAAGDGEVVAPVYDGTDTDIYVSTDRGQSWNFAQTISNREPTIVIHGDGGWALQVNDGSNFEVYKSTDAISWSQGTLPASAFPFGPISYSNGTFFYSTFTSPSTIETHRSYDLSSWTVVDTGTFSLFAIEENGVWIMPTVDMVSGDSVIKRSVDNGTTWATVKTISNYFTQFAAGIGNLYVVSGVNTSTDDAFAWRSSDGGITFSSVTGFPSTSNGAVTSVGRSFYTITIDGDVYSSENGSDWFNVGSVPADSYSFIIGLGISSGGLCDSPEMPAGALYYNKDKSALLYCDGGNWVALGAPIDGGSSGNPCVSPHGTEGTIFYNKDEEIYQYCNGDEWTSFILAKNYETVGWIAFEPVTGQPVSTQITSNIEKYEGSESSLVSISGDGAPEYRICSNQDCSSVVHTWTSANEVVDDGEYLQIRLTTSSAMDETYSVALTIGITGATWSAETFSVSFGSLTGQPVSTLIASEIRPVLVSGSQSISISGDGSPQYRICSNDDCSTVTHNWSSSNGTIDGGEYIQLRMTTPGAVATDAEVVLSFGSDSASWSIRTYGCDASGSQTFDYTGSVQSMAIDNSNIACDFTITVKGAGGGSYIGAPAGAGGGTQFDYAPPEAGTLYMLVGQKGSAGGSYLAYGGGACGGQFMGGGGASAIRFENVSAVSTVLAVAGGGGGGQKFSGNGAGLNNAGQNAGSATGGSGGTGGSNGGGSGGGDGSPKTGGCFANGSVGGDGYPAFLVSGGGTAFRAAGGGGYGGGGAYFDGSDYSNIGGAGGGGYLNTGAVEPGAASVAGAARDADGSITIEWALP